jgi:hypothetical protein
VILKALCCTMALFAAIGMLGVALRNRRERRRPR